LQPLLNSVQKLKSSMRPVKVTVSEVTLEEKPTLWYALAILAGVTLCSKVKHTGLLGSFVSYSEIKVL
jgi:hypothetical protein